MTQHNETQRPAIEPYLDANGPQPRRRLIRTWLRRARPLRQFAPRIEFDIARDRPNPEIAAHWGEHMLVDDFATVLHRDGTISCLRHIVTQLHSPEALMQWDQITRYWDARAEHFRTAQLRLFLPDGTTRKATRTQQVVAAPGTYSNRHGRYVQIVYAPLPPGVIVEFEEFYDQFRPDETGPTMWNNFFLSTRAPAVRRRFTVAAAEPFTMTTRVHHSDQRSAEQKVGKYTVQTWDVRDVEGVETDEWTPPANDYVPWVDIGTATTWAPFAHKLYKELEPPLAPSDVRELALGLAAQKTTGREKAIAAYQYAAQSVRYGRPPSELTTRNIRGSAQIIEDLRGDCKDKSALLVQLLRSMELTANIAVVQTGDGGRTQFLPSMRFNHALVKLSLASEVIWLDPAGGPFSFGELPPSDENIAALVLERTGYYFDRIPARDSSTPTEQRELNGQLTAAGHYSFGATIHFRGETAARLRMNLTDRIEAHRHEALQRWLGNDYPGAIGREFSHDKFDELIGVMSYYCRGELEHVARPLKNFLLLHVPWANSLVMNGPMTAVSRRQPLVVPQSYYTLERHTIELPPATQVIAAPEPVKLECPWGRYRCEYKAADGKLSCERSFELQGQFVPSVEFPAFREFWRQCSWSDRAEVVLGTSEVVGVDAD